MRGLLGALGAGLAMLTIAPAVEADTRASLVLGPSDQLAATLNMPTNLVGCPPAPIVVTGGPVSLGGATLALTSTYPLGAGMGCVLIDNQAGGPINGTFAGLPEGAIFGPPNARYEISYAFQGNDVLLRRVEVAPTIDISAGSGPGDTNMPLETSRTVTLHVQVLGDTPTSLAAPGSVTVTVGGNVVGTFPLQFGGATVPLGFLPAGEHSVSVSYGGGSSGGRLLLLAGTATTTLRVRAPLVPTFPDDPRTPAPGADPSSAPSPASPSPPGEQPNPGASAPMVLPAVADARIGRRSISFVQVAPAAGTLRWRLSIRAAGRGEAVVRGHQAVDRGRLRVRLPLTKRGQRLLARARAARIDLKTTLVAADGQTISARTRLR